MTDTTAPRTHLPVGTEIILMPRHERTSQRSRVPHPPAGTESILPSVRLSPR